MTATDLTPGAISMLLSGKYASIFKPVVQVIDIRCTNTRTEVNNNRVEQHASYREILLSDGSVCEDVIIDYKIEEMILSKKLKKGSIVRLTKFACNTNSFHSYISVYDLKVIRLNCIIFGNLKPFSGNQTPSVNKFKPPKLEEEPVDPDMNDHLHDADEPKASKHNCCPCSQTQSKKRDRQSSDYKENDEIGACFEKLEKLGWEEGPMYDTTVLLFGESSDYRKIWLHLKPNSCPNWVKNAGSKYGLLG